MGPPLIEIDEGFDFKVLIVDDAWVVRWPRHRLAVEEIGQEAPAGESLLAETETLTGFRPALTHSDLLPEHLLVHDGRLAGVIDWGDARIGDPALDYAWLMNGPFPDWDVDGELRRRALIYHRLGPWFDTHSGVFIDRPERIRSGLAGIRSRL